MLTAHRCHGHRIWDGVTYLDLPDGEGGTVRVPSDFRFAQGLRRDHAEAIQGRPELARPLWDLGMWGADADDLDAAVEALLARHPQAGDGDDPTTSRTSAASR